MHQLPPGARAHIHLGAEGAGVSDDQRSLPRVLFATLCATLILVAAPLAWASAALGADQGAPVATISKSGPGHDGDDDEDDGDDDSGSSTGSKGTESSDSGTGRNKTTAGAGNDDSNTTTSNSAGTTQTRTTTGKKKRAVNETTTTGS